MSESDKQPAPTDVERLARLAEQIRDSHGRCLASFRTGVQHARRTGDLLHEAKRLVRPKKWQDWVDENCRFELRMAQNYMRIAAHSKKVEEKSGPVDQFTMTQVLGLIKKMLDGEDGVPRAVAPDRAGNAAAATEQAGGGKGGNPPGAVPPSEDPDAAYRLPEGGYKLKRQELDARRAGDGLAVEEDAKLARYVVQKLEAIYASVRRQARKELADLARVGNLDPAHLAIIVIDKLKKSLDAEKVFLAPAEPKPAEEDTSGEAKTAEEQVRGGPTRDRAPVHRVKEFMNGHADVAGVGG